MLRGEKRGEDGGHSAVALIHQDACGCAVVVQVGSCDGAEYGGVLAETSQLLAVKRILMFRHCGVEAEPNLAYALGCATGDNEVGAPVVVEIAYCHCAVSHLGKCNIGSVECASLVFKQSGIGISCYVVLSFFCVVTTFEYNYLGSAIQLA